MSQKKNTVIGFTEIVTIEKNKYEARIDTGAKTSSIDKEIVEKLGLGPKVGQKTIRNAHGKTVRDVIKIDVKIQNRKLKNVKFTVANRKKLTYPVLVGRNIIKRGFIVNPEVSK